MALSVSFNRPRTSFVVAHDSGFQVYGATDGLETVNELPEVGAPVRCAAMMDSHPYVLVVKHLTEEVELWDCRMGRGRGDGDDSNGKVHSFRPMPADAAVRRVLVTPEHSVVVCRDGMSVFDSGTAERLAYFETATNERGLGALGGGGNSSGTGITSGKSYVAVPGRTRGQVQVVELGKGGMPPRVRHVFPAHRSALSALDISDDARYVATANESGTIFKIFALPEQALVKQLRRGVDGADIYSLRMSPDNAFLAATSGNGTLHIFTLANVTPETEEIDQRQQTQGWRQQQSPASPLPPPPKSPLGAVGSATEINDEREGSVRARSETYLVGGTKYPASLFSASPPDDYDIVDENAPSAPNSKQPAGPKFGVLGKLPFAPAILTDQYPNASTKFDHGRAAVRSSPQETPGPHPYGQLCWLDAGGSDLVVVRVRPDCAWERFRVRNAVDEWRLERVTARQLAR